jgi:hypothetical protein
MFSFLQVQAVWGQATDAPVAADDFFNTKIDSVLNVALPGVLENDDPALNDSLLVLIVDPPLNGTVFLQTDGSFAYTPDPGFSGIDGFSYLIETLPKQVLSVDTTSSQLKFSMKVITDAGSARDSTEAVVGGTAGLFVEPEAGPFMQAHLFDLDLVVAEQVNLEFKFGGLIVLGRLFVAADSGAFHINLSQRGAPAEVMDGSFTQNDNKITIQGIVDLDGTGVIAPFVPDEPQEFDTETDANFEGILALEDTLVTLAVPVFLYEEFELGGTDVEMTVSGTIASAGGLRHSLESNLATVSITVEPLTNTGTEDELPVQYALAQNYPNPFNPVTTIAFSIPSSEVVTLRVYDTLGREVATLVDGLMPAGQHEVRFEAGDLPSGMYVYRLETNGFNQSKKLVLLR